MSMLSWIIPFIIPPLAGAIIGYVTNVVAIKMLFRPLKEIRLFGRRLPFTPGILPKERHKLAESIGRMVEQELITSEVLRERLKKSEVRENIKTTLGSYTDQILERPVSYWLEERSEEFPIREFLNDFVNSEVFDSLLEHIIKNWIVGQSSSEEELNMSSWFKSRFRDFGALLVPPARNMIKNGLVREMKNQERGEGSSYRMAMEKAVEKYPGIKLKEFLSIGEQKKLRLDSLLAEKAADTLDENVEGALSSVNVRALVTDRINSLEMLRVEKIVLDVMAGQLKWINFFGAILGALIGFVQILLSYLTDYLAAFF